MKLLTGVILMVVISSLTLASCNNDQNPVKQYGDTLSGALKSAKKLDATVNVEEVKKSIQEFYAANGRYPADLGEVSKFNGITLKSDQYVYDPSTGSLRGR